MAHTVARAPEVTLPDLDTLGGGKGDVDQAHGLGGIVGGGPCDAGDGDAKVGAEGGADAGGHLPGRFLRWSK